MKNLTLEHWDAVYEAAHGAVAQFTDTIPTWLITTAVNAAVAEIERQLEADEGQ